YLELVAAERVAVAPLIDRIAAIESAPAVYDELAKAEGSLPLGVMIEYPDGDAVAEHNRITIAGHRAAPAGRINYVLVGAGAFGTAMLVPRRRKRDAGYVLRGVVSRSSQGSNFARDNQVEVLASDLDAVLHDPDFHLVVLATRHHEHADQVVQALAVGKHIFVEKPLAISWDELDRIVAANDAGP